MQRREVVLWIDADGEPVFEVLRNPASPETQRIAGFSADEELVQARQEVDEWLSLYVETRTNG